MDLMVRINNLASKMLVGKLQRRRQTSRAGAWTHVHARAKCPGFSPDGGHGYERYGLREWGSTSGDPMARAFEYRHINCRR